MIIHEDFSTSYWWRADFHTEFRRWDETVDAGYFKVKDGQGHLVATRKNIRGVYLKSVDVPFTPEGFTVATQTQRTANDGGMTEFEMGRDEWGPIWHFEWSDTYLWYFLAGWSKGLPFDLIRGVRFKRPNSVLRFDVTCLPDCANVTVRVTDVISNEVLLDRTDPLDWTGLGPLKTGSHLNWVTTGNDKTTPESPVAQMIDWIWIGPVGSGPDLRPCGFWCRLWRRLFGN